MKKSYRIVLAGNPNCGKTSIFNQLTGTRQHVGNYPGVTVESKKGYFELSGMQIELVDLPGIYSLSSSSPEEKVAFQELISPGIDLILNVVDASIPQRNLYLTTQLAELNIPMLLAFNMSDEAEKKGFSFKFAELEKYFSARIVQTVGTHLAGVAELKRVLQETLPLLGGCAPPRLSYCKEVDAAILAISEEISSNPPHSYLHIPPRFFAIKLLERDISAVQMPELRAFLPAVEEQISLLDSRRQAPTETLMADCRYALISGACRHCITASRERRWEISDRIDSVVTNKILGLPIFLLIMYVTFWITFTCAEPLMGGVEFAVARLSELLAQIWPDEYFGLLKSLLIDGVLGGVGGVIVFLPNIILLFLSISFLEDSGYMARAAFVMDGIMRKFGLHGKSFVPLVLGFGCTVPAIMSARSIESEKDRLTTILILPLMSCSARLPIYALIIPAFFAAGKQATIMLFIYLIGVVFALLAAWVMKRTLFKEESDVYIMELPPYRMPTLKSIMLHMWDRSLQYLHKAGTIILAASIVLFIANTFPKKKSFSNDYDAMAVALKETHGLSQEQIKTLAESGMLDKASREFLLDKQYLDRSSIAEIQQLPLSNEQRMALQVANEYLEERQKLDFARQAEAMSFTFAGRFGKFLEPAFRPLGFDWRICTAMIGSLAAREVFVSQLGILFSVGGSEEDSLPLRQYLRLGYTPLQGFCMMLFCLLSVPCLATLVIIHKELNSWKLAVADGVGLFLLAYFTTLLVYQMGSLLGIGVKLIAA